jgi:hypothetical protein
MRDSTEQGLGSLRGVLVLAGLLLAATLMLAKPPLSSPPAGALPPWLPDGARVLNGRLPDELSFELSLPPGARVRGSTVYGPAVASVGIDFGAALEGPAPHADVVAFYERELVRRGWWMPPADPGMAAPRPASAFCQTAEGPSLWLTLGAGAWPTEVGLAVSMVAPEVCTPGASQQVDEQACHELEGACPLVGASEERIAERAIAYTWGILGLPTGGVCVLQGEPSVVLVRQVSATELEALNIAPSEGVARPLWLHVAGDRSRPLYLVILRGAFYYAGNFARGERIGPPVEALAARYIAQVLDGETGRLIWTETSSLGGRFRAALNDPTLPDDPPASPTSSVDTPLTCQLPPS